MADTRIHFSYFYKVILMTIWSLEAVCQPEVQEGAIRLGTNPRRGIVEVFFEGQWGTISNVNLNDATPAVICRDLGFNGNVETMEETVFRGTWNTPVWRVDCSETDSSIINCERRLETMDGVVDFSYSVTIGELYDHNNDLGVICKNSAESVNTAIFLVIDFVAFGIALICIFICAYLAYYCATRSNKPEGAAPRQGDDGYQSYEKPDASAPAYTGYIVQSHPPEGSDATTAGPSPGTKKDGEYMDITTGV